MLIAQLFIAGRVRVARSTLFLLALFLAFPRVAPAADSLEKALLEQAPKILTHLHERGCKNVGVLRFLVAQDGGKPSDSIGLLNQTLANRLEIALTLSLDVKNSLGIIQNASAVAAKLTGANHLTAAGRKVLFSGKYPLAWGIDEVTADAFLTGVARVSADLKEMSIAVQAFDREHPEPAKLLQFSVAGDVIALAEGGESFLLRGGNLEVLPTAEEARREAARVRAAKATHPLLEEMAPVTLEVLYDDKPVKLTVADGVATVPEPREGQKVALVIRRRGESKERLAAVVKVNGESTLFKQRDPDPLCAKWVVEPNAGPLTLTGFYSVDDKDPSKQKVTAFRILSATESKAGEVRYGADAGLITLTVFGEKRAKAPPPTVEEGSDNSLAVVRGVLPESKPKNLLALRAQLRSAARRGLDSRGLIGEGDKDEAKLRAVGFDLDPMPRMLAAVRYYKPTR